MFGDIVKVTPSSKVVGDMALMMVSQGLGPADVLDPKRDIAFPTSVVEMLRGDLGQPPGGWPVELQAKALKGEAASTARPGSLLADADLAVATIRDREAAREARQRSGARFLPDVSEGLRRLRPRRAQIWARFRAADARLFYGMQVGDEVNLGIEKGKALDVRLQAIGETDEEGQVRIFFELNGQPRIVKVPNRSATASVAGASQGGGRERAAYRRADAGSRGDDRGEAGAAGEGRRSPLDPRGDEDGDVALRSPRWQDQ